MTEHLPSPGTGGLTSLPLSPASSGLTPHAGEDRPTDIHSVQRNVSAGQRPVSPSVPPVQARRDAGVTAWQRAMDATADDLHASWVRLQAYEDLEEDALGLPEHVGWAEAEAALDRATATEAMADDPRSDLGDSQRAVLAYVARKTRRRARLQLALYVPDVATETRLTERETHHALRGLQRKGYLHLVRQGQADDGLGLYALPAVAEEGGW